MELMTRSVGILLGRKEVGSYVRQVAEAADRNRESLGWFPFKVFEESATREKLIVAVVREGDQDVYAGHLLFETTFPRGHVLQIHVPLTHRRQGLATTLLTT